MAEEQIFQCNGDCLKCRAIADRKVQWQYCAAQHAYNSMKMIEALQKSVESMQVTINNLTEKIEAIQSVEPVAVRPACDSEVSNLPLFKDMAQNGSGAGIGSQDN